MSPEIRPSGVNRVSRPCLRDLRCPYCGGHIVVPEEEFDWPQIFDGIDLASDGDWECPDCDARGKVSFYAEITDIGIQDEYGEDVYQVTRSPSKKAPAKRKSPAKRTTATKRTPATRKPATRRTTTKGAKR